MATPRFSGVDEGQRVRQLRKELRRVETKEEPGPGRAALLAGLVRAAHEARQLNMAMHAAQLCLDEDPDPPALIVAAYVTEDLTDVEERLRTLDDLQDLGRYVGHDQMRDWAAERVRDEARTWLRDATDVELPHRARALTSIIGRDLTDELRDELRFL